MKTPSFLKKGDKIAIVSTARKISPEDIAVAVTTFNSWGLDVYFEETLFSSYHQFAGDDNERRAYFQRMLDDDAVRAIICARGGYGTIRIIDGMDFSRFIRKPKWIVGYSDITVLHSHVSSNFGIETIHGIMPFNITGSPFSLESAETLRIALFGESLKYRMPSAGCDRPGKCKGILTGGNLSIIYSLSASVSDIVTDGKILFLEDLDEYLYHIDRMMMNLKRAGKLEKLAGLIVGHMSKMRDNEVHFGATAYEIVMDAVSEFDYPVFCGFPAGHEEDNRALIMGREVRMEVDDGLVLSF